MNCDARRPRWCVASLRSVRFLATRFPATAFFVIAALVGFGAKCCADQHEDCTATQCYPWLTCESYIDAESQPAKTCEIECTDNTDCPCGQTCVDVTPGPGLVCMECTSEGIATDDPATCCEGLSAMSACLPDDIGCDDGFFCTACGDGVCGEHESPWECPADCADCATLGLDAATCAKSTVEYWVAEKRRQTAAELSAMPFADRAEAIADRAWYGRVPGTAYTEMHDDGAVDLLLGLRLTPEMLGLSDVAASGSAADLADAFVARHGATLLGLGAEHGTLTSSTIQDWGSNREVIVLRQNFSGVSVVGGMLSLTFDEFLNLVEIGNGLLPGIVHGTTPDVSLEEALMVIARQANAPVVAVRSGLFIYPGQTVRTESRLTYEIAVADSQTGEGLGAFRVDAITGEVLEKHGYEWRWPDEGEAVPFPPPSHHYARFNLIDLPYDEAYDCGGDVCDLVSGYSAGNGTTATDGLSYDETTIWGGGGEWTDEDDDDPLSDYWEEPVAGSSVLDEHEIDEMKPAAYLIEKVLWPFIVDYGLEGSGALGYSGSPRRFVAKARMGGQTVGFNNAYVDNNIFTVEGAFGLGTVGHEFGHSTGNGASPIQIKPDTSEPEGAALEEGRADAWGSIMKTLYSFPEEPDPDQPEIMCYDQNGALQDLTPAELVTGGKCFNVWDGNLPFLNWDDFREEYVLGGYRHQNLQVQQIQHETRCSAIETLYLEADQADMGENIWRSMSDPEQKNHGHGRGPATYDRLLADNANVFQAGVWESATNEFWEDAYRYQFHYCGNEDPDNNAICVCSEHYGVSHMNNGIHNSFFFSLSGLTGADHSLGGNPRNAANAQMDLLQSLYTVEFSSYLEWAQKVAELSDSTLGGFTPAQRTDIAGALRDTGLYLKVGQFDTTELGGGQPSDLEAVPFFGDADDQRLLVFHRAADDADEVVLPREVGYSIYDLSGSSGTAELVGNCALPTVPTPESDEAPVSGFAPTAVNLGDRIWVAWVQYDATQPTQKFGHLAYATLQLDLTSMDGCGSWSEVVYDPETEVYGSLRSTLVDRGYVWNWPFQWIDCPNPPCFDWPFDDWMAYVNPPDYATLGMLENLGFELDDVQNGAMGGSAPPPPQEDLDNAIEALRLLATTDGLGVSRQPTSRDVRAPQSADMSIELNMRELNVGLAKASASAPEITEALSALLPNTMSFLDGLRASPAPIGVRMSLWEPPPPPPEVGGDLEVGALLEVPLLSVSTVAVSFLGEEQGTDGRRHAIVREYGAAEDPFEPIDHLVGYATYTPGLATVGQTQDEGSGFISVVRDNVVACSDFVYDSLSDDEIDRMSCMVFMGADFTPAVEGIRKLKPGMEIEGVEINDINDLDGDGDDNMDYVPIGISVDIAASPRLVNVGDIIYIAYRIGELPDEPPAVIDPVRFLAVRGPEFGPVTYNTLMSGLEYPASFDGPRKPLVDRKLEIVMPAQPATSVSSLWPVFPAAFFASEYGGMGYLGVRSWGDLELYARGSAW